MIRFLLAKCVSPLKFTAISQRGFRIETGECQKMVHGFLNSSKGIRNCSLIGRARASVTILNLARLLEILENLRVKIRYSYSKAMRKYKGLFMNDWEWQSQISISRVVADHVEKIILHLTL